ncbi:MbeB family mobilization protein [Aeromonas veronii]|nr:MbeB family mobilization protein [Aeromonas veronii]
MAKTFEQTSKQQADDIESSLKPEFEKHEKRKVLPASADGRQQPVVA